MEKAAETSSATNARQPDDDDNDDTNVGAAEYYDNSSSSNVKRARLQSTLTALLADPILSDVPKQPTLSDVDTLISLELGSAMRISVRKLDSTTFDVAVMNMATVKDLKLAIKKKVNDVEQCKMGHRHISWKHVWANLCLAYRNEKLLDDNTSLQDYQIRNNSQVHFLPYVMSKASQKHSRRRKHRFFHGLIVLFPILILFRGRLARGHTRGSKSTQDETRLLRQTKTQEKRLQKHLIGEVLKMSYTEPLAQGPVSITQI